MVNRFLPHSALAADELIPVLDLIRAELEIPASFPLEVQAQAERATAQWREFLSAAGVAPLDTAPARLNRKPRDLPRLDMAIDPSWDALHASALPSLDATHIPLVTIDPPGSKDLDQAIYLRRLDQEEPGGALFEVIYAIASTATFIPPGSPLDLEVRSRGLTTYFPDRTTPLHPPTLSEGAASLLPGQASPACLWRILLGPDGAALTWSVRRAVVRSRAQLTYEDIQDAIASIDEGDAVALRDGVPSDLPVLLREIGELRLLGEKERGGVSARIPEQEILRETEAGGPHFRLAYRSNMPSEEWNAQISLLTGICAAATMRGVGIGVLRTVPAASPSSMRRLRAVARALDVDWPESEPYADLVRRLESGTAHNAAFLLEATSLFRGAGYAVFGVEGTSPFPPLGAPDTRHEAIAAEYAHATAPLRRLVDRWSEEICLAVHQGEPVPQWIIESVAEVPGLMGKASQRVATAEREVMGAIQALLLEGRVGQTFTGAIVDVDERNGGRPANTAGARSGGPRGTVMIADPAVMARVVPEDPTLSLPLGEVVDVRLTVVDVAGRRIEFVWPADEAAFSAALRAERRPGRSDGNARGGDVAHLTK